MAWTSPRDWTTGELVTASMMNTHVRDNLDVVGASKLTSSTVETAVGASSTAENTLISYTVPAGVIGANRILRFEARGTWRLNAAAPDQLDVRFKWGGTTEYTSSHPTNWGSAQPWRLIVTVIPDNAATGAQYGQAEMAGVNTAVFTDISSWVGAIDTTGTVAILVTAQFGASDANNNVTVQAYSVHLIPAEP